MMDFREFQRRYQKTEVKHYPNTVSKNPLVSVLVQTYNHEEFIRECLNSVLAQKTNFNFEIILGEDCSEDKTRDICIDYARKYPGKIRLILHDPENKIFVEDIKTGNFNAFYNLYNARGNFIAFCEGDDYWGDPNKLQHQIDFLKSNESYSFCYHKFLESKNRKINKSNNLIQPLFDISGYNIQILKYHPLLSTVCFRKNIDLPEEITEVINVDSFLLSVLGNYGPARFLNQIRPNIYRRHNNGVWSNKSKVRNLRLKKNTFKKLRSYYERMNKVILVQCYSKKIRNINKSLIYIFFNDFSIKKF